MGTLLQDIRYGFRMLAKKPGLTIAMVLTLSLGIGAGTAIFSVVDKVLLRPLPLTDAGRLLTIREADPQRSRAHDRASSRSWLGRCGGEAPAHWQEGKPPRLPRSAGMR